MYGVLRVDLAIGPLLVLVRCLVCALLGLRATAIDRAHILATLQRLSSTPSSGPPQVPPQSAPNDSETAGPRCDHHVNVRPLRVLPLEHRLVRVSFGSWHLAAIHPPSIHVHIHILPLVYHLQAQATSATSSLSHQAGRAITIPPLFFFCPLCHLLFLFLSSLVLVALLDPWLRRIHSVYFRFPNTRLEQTTATAAAGLGRRPR